MAVKLSDLSTEGSPQSTDIIPIADPTTGVMRKITISALKTLLDGIGGGPDVTAPTIVTATATSGNIIVIVFSESVTVTTAGWSFKLNGGAWGISSVSGSGNTWTFTMSTSAISSDTLLMSYNSGTGNTVDTASNELVTFTDSAVTNSIPGNQLATPTLTATAKSPTVIDLSWTNVANESSYQLEWSPNGSTSWTQIGGTIAANTTTYSHTSLTAGTLYYYRIKAVGDGVTYTDSPYGTANTTTGTYLTWGTLATKQEVYNSSKGIRKKTGEGNSWHDGTTNVSVSNQTIAAGQRVVVKVTSVNTDTFMFALASGTTAVDVFGATGSPFGIVSVPFVVGYGKEEGANAPGTPSESLSDGQFWAIWYENASTVKYQKSSDGLTWTTWYTSTNTPSGSYYVHVQINAELTGPEEIYKV